MKTKKFKFLWMLVLLCHATLMTAEDFVLIDGKTISGEIIEYGENTVSVFNGDTIEVLSKKDILFLGKDLDRLKKFETQILKLSPLSGGQEIVILDSGKILRGKTLSFKGSEMILDLGSEGIRSVDKSDLLAVYYGSGAVNAFFGKLAELPKENDISQQGVMGLQDPLLTQPKKPLEKTQIPEKKEAIEPKIADQKKQPEQAVSQKQQPKTIEEQNQPEKWYMSSFWGVGPDLSSNTETPISALFQFGFFLTLSDQVLLGVSADYLVVNESLIVSSNLVLWVFFSKMLDGFYLQASGGPGISIDGSAFTGKFGLGYAINRYEYESAWLLGVNFNFASFEKNTGEYTVSYYSTEQKKETVSAASLAFYLGVMW